MGAGIAMSFADAGIPVMLLEIERAGARQRRGDDPRELRGARRRRASYGATRSTQSAGAAVTDAFATTTSATPISSIEAVFEDMEIKREVFATLDAVTKPGAILATNTSTLDVEPLAAATRRPQDVRRHALLQSGQRDEAARSRARRETGADVLATVMQLAKRIGKTAVVAGVCDGFIGNRMIEHYLRQAMFLVDEGASPAQVDARAREVRHGDGPVPHERSGGHRRRLAHPPAPLCRRARTCRIRGSPIGCASWDASARRRAPAGIATKPGRRDALPDPAVDALIAEYRKRDRHRAAQDRATTRSSTAASSRWSTKARASSTKASRSARPTSTSST